MWDELIKLGITLVSLVAGGSEGGGDSQSVSIPQVPLPQLGAPPNAMGMPGMDASSAIGSLRPLLGQDDNQSGHAAQMASVAFNDPFMLGNTFKKNPLLRGY